MPTRTGCLSIPARLEVVDERLRLYTELARKYGGTTESAVLHLDDSHERLEFLEGGEEDLSRLEEIREAETARALELAAQLSAARREAVASPGGGRGRCSWPAWAWCRRGSP